jgi:transcription antitermination factor NusG
MTVGAIGEDKGEGRITRAVIEPSALRWFVLRVPPQKEATVIRIFNLVGFAAFIPTIPRERIRRGRKTSWRVPVMPTYVLIGFPGVGQIPWWEVLKFELIKKIITLEDKPLQVPWETRVSRNGKSIKAGVAHLLDDEDRIRVGASKYMRIWRAYATGDMVRIEAGPFFGFEGKVDNIDDDGVDAKVLLDIFGRQTMVQIPVGDAVKAA